MGDYLRGAGRKAVLAGKTHVLTDHRGLDRLQLDGDGELETLLAGGGFTSIDRYDGHSPPGRAWPRRWTDCGTGTTPARAA